MKTEQLVDLHEVEAYWKSRGLVDDKHLPYYIDHARARARSCKAACSTIERECRPAAGLSASAKETGDKGAGTL